MPRRRPSILSASLVLALPLAGCGWGGAPTRVIVGAYFPAWMLCALVGIGAAIAARLIMIALRLADVLPHQLAVSLAVGVLVAAAFWLLWFGA